MASSPLMGREPGYHILSWVGLLPQPTPGLSVCVAPERPLLNTRLSGLPSTVQHIFQQHLRRWPARVPAKGRRWTAGASKWVMFGILTISVAAEQIIMLNFSSFLVLMWGIYSVSLDKDLKDWVLLFKKKTKKLKCLFFVAACVSNSYLFPQSCL